MKLVRSKTTKHVRVANAISGTRAQYYVIDACNCYELRQKRENGMARHPDHAERASVLNRAFEGRRRRRRSRNGLANESEKRTERKRVRDVSGAEEERVGDTE